MAWNLNYDKSTSREYDLIGRLTDQVIASRGIPIKYIHVEKVDIDRLLGDIQHLRADNQNIFEMYAYPENPESMEGANDFLSKFGIMSLDSTNLFISKYSVESVLPNYDIQNMHGDVIVLPSGKYLEVTDVIHQVKGINNLFAYKDQKNVYMFKCKAYTYNHDELPVVNQEDTNYTGLDELFGIIQRDEDKQLQDDPVQSPVVKDKDPIFGDLG